MYSIIHRLAVGMLMSSLLWAGFASAQESRKVGLNLGFSAWPNNCDIPAGGQDTGITLSFGPFFSLRYGKFSMSGTFYFGNYDVEPHHGLERTTDPDSVIFADEQAAQRGFTSIGETQRIDVGLSLDYEFNKNAWLSLSLAMNRHEADVDTYWYPLYNNGELVLPNDPNRRARLKYTDTQFWIGESLHGAVPIGMISNRFSLIYNAALLFIVAETGTGEVIDPDGVPVDVGPRPAYKNENGEIIFPPERQPTRSLGSNVGFAFNTGLSFELLDTPSIVFFAGYNVKFFSENETDLIDHSVFKGPFFGISYRIY